MNELKFLAGTFFNFDIPKDKKYLLKYFPTPFGQTFVKYYMCMSEIEYFSNHTGQIAQKRWLTMLKRRFETLIALHHKFKIEGNLELLKQLEKGKYDLESRQ